FCARFAKGGYDVVHKRRLFRFIHHATWSRREMLLRGGTPQFWNKNRKRVKGWVEPSELLMASAASYLSLHQSRGRGFRQRSFAAARVRGSHPFANSAKRMGQPATVGHLREDSFAPSGLAQAAIGTHGLRRGLHSCAATRLGRSSRLLG